MLRQNGKALQPVLFLSGRWRQGVLRHGELNHLPNSVYGFLIDTQQVVKEKIPYAAQVHVLLDFVTEEA